MSARRLPFGVVGHDGLAESKEDRFVGCFSHGEFMAQYVPSFVIIAGAVAGMGYSIAACLREWFRGRALLLRAKRGDPEPASVILLPDREKRP